MRRFGRIFRRAPVREPVAALALIALIARALIPLGFMPGVVDGRPRLVICDGRMSGSADLGRHGRPGSSAETPCPFAHCWGAAPPPSTLGVSLASTAPMIAVPFIERTVPAGAPPRYSAARGPPSPA